MTRSSKELMQAMPTHQKRKRRKTTGQACCHCAQGQSNEGQQRHGAVAATWRGDAQHVCDHAADAEEADGKAKHEDVGQARGRHHEAKMRTDSSVAALRPHHGEQ